MSFDRFYNEKSEKISRHNHEHANRTARRRMVENSCRICRSAVNCLIVRILVSASMASYLTEDWRQWRTHPCSMKRFPRFLTVLAWPISAPTRLLVFISCWIFKKVIVILMNRDINTMDVNVGLIKRPTIRQTKNMANASQVKPNRVLTSCWMDNASVDRRVQIAPEVFSARSK